MTPNWYNRNASLRDFWCIRLRCIWRERSGHVFVILFRIFLIIAFPRLWNKERSKTTKETQVEGTNFQVDNQGAHVPTGSRCTENIPFPSASFPIPIKPDFRWNSYIRDASGRESTFKLRQILEPLLYKPSRVSDLKMKCRVA